MSENKIIVVDEASCSGCALCEELALKNIEVPLRTDVAVVTKQPANAEEWESCLEAVRECPTDGLSVRQASREDAPVKVASREDDPVKVASHEDAPVEEAPRDDNAL